MIDNLQWNMPMFNWFNKPYQAFLNSCNGLRYAFQSQWTFKLELFVLLIGIPFACLLTQQILERILLISSLLLLPMMELFNSAIETVVDRISLEHHVLSGLAKDLASAALLVAILNAIFIWSMVFFNHF